MRKAWPTLNVSLVKTKISIKKQNVAKFKGAEICLILYLPCHSRPLMLLAIVLGIWKKFTPVLRCPMGQSFKLEFQIGNSGKIHHDRLHWHEHAWHQSSMAAHRVNFRKLLNPGIIPILFLNLRCIRNIYLPLGFHSPTSLMLLVPLPCRGNWKPVTCLMQMRVGQNLKFDTIFIFQKFLYSLQARATHQQRIDVDWRQVVFLQHLY